MVAPGTQSRKGQPALIRRFQNTGERHRRRKTESQGNGLGRGTGIWREERIIWIKGQGWLFLNEGQKIQTTVPLLPLFLQAGKTWKPRVRPAPCPAPPKPVSTTPSHR